MRAYAVAVRLALGVSLGYAADSPASASGCTTLDEIERDVGPGGGLATQIAAIQGTLAAVSTAAAAFTPADVADIETAVGAAGPIQTSIDSLDTDLDDIEDRLSALAADVALIDSATSSSEALVDGIPTDYLEWTNVGTLQDFTTLLTTFPPADFRYGVVYNTDHDYVHPVVISGTASQRILMTQRSYSHRDSGTAFIRGYALFYCGTADVPGTCATHWVHRYYEYFGGGFTPYSSNGTANDVPLYVRRHP